MSDTTTLRETDAPSRLAEVDFDDLVFGTVFSDHMLIAEYADGAWGRPELTPYGPLPTYPSISALHYAISVFEGFKAQRTVDGRVAVFRAADNWARMNRSARRLVMPEVPREVFVDGLLELIDRDRDWVPSAEQGSLYIRPTYHAVDTDLRVGPGKAFRFVILTCPVGSYFAGSLGLTTNDEYVRAFPGGTGDIKPAGNYAGALLATEQAKADGYQHVLWLDGREGRYVEEAGVMNVFFVIDGTVVTPALQGTVLPGITRDSVLQIVRDRGLPLEERPIAVEEVIDAAENGTLTEVFGVGTAAIIAPVDRLRLKGHQVELSYDDETIAQSLRAELLGIQRGDLPDRHGWVTII